MFGMYECHKYSFNLFNPFLLMDFLSNASYSGYRNHIQKDTLQENVKFGQCD